MHKQPLNDEIPDEQDRHMRDFISHISHELNTPLTSMTFGIGNLLNGVLGPLPDRVVEYLRLIESDCRRLTCTVTDSLDAGRVKAGRVQNKIRRQHMQATEKQKILLIDDDQNILRSLGDFLKFKTFEVETASSAEDGLRKLDDFSPAIILLDLGMPGIGGMGFLRRIMRDDGSLPYPVLVFTARQETESFFDDVPVAGFLPKPCSQTELIDEIHRILQIDRQDRRKKTVLIGEDEDAFADALTKELQAAGFEVVCAGTGPEVLEKAVLHQPDVFLLKKIMTGMNGDATASMLQSMPRTKGIPVILYDSTENQPSRHLAGIARFVASQETAPLVRAVGELISAG